jgi:hypothetical protein
MTRAGKTFIQSDMRLRNRQLNTQESNENEE